MRVLLTGGAGFLGRACKVDLQARGFEVITTDLRVGADLQGDLALDAFAAALPEVDAVVHAAAVQYVSPDLPWLDRARYFRRNNVDATAGLCTRYAGKAVHFVNVGTSMMYRQGGEGPITVSSPMAPQGVYSHSKLMAQELVTRHFSQSSTVVPCIIGGPGRGGLFKGFVRSIQRRGRVLLAGPCDHRTHMVHVSDVAALIGQVVEQRVPGFFNAGAPEPLSIRQWVDVIASELGVARPRTIELPLGPVTWAAYLSGYRLLAREQVLMLRYPHQLDISGSLGIGWQPRYNNAEIARATAREIARTGD